jgi:ABC-2 type transport system ATP-binding protein
MSFFTMSSIITIKDLHKSFGTSLILNGVHLEIGPNTVYGLVGLNGAGKTTLLRLLLGLLKPSNGTINVAGHNPWDHSEAYYSKLGVVLEHDGFWGNLTIKENLKIFASAKKLLWSDVLLYIDQFWGNTVVAVSDKKVKHLSRGQRMQCALCRAFLGWPEIVFLDEPAIALDMTAYDHFKGIVRNAKNRGAAMIISSHQLDTIDELCDRVGNLSNGTLQDLQLHGESGFYSWILSTDHNSLWEKILSEYGCRNITWEADNWSFCVDKPESRIPVIIRKLVEAGCQIFQIKQDTAGFGETIRSMYKTSQREDHS